MDGANEAARSGYKDPELDFAVRSGDDRRAGRRGFAWPAFSWLQLAATPISLRTCSLAAGVVWAIAFVVVGLSFHLQMYGDGSMFSYAVAVEDAWAFHWHNISSRVLVYLYAYLPSEAYVELFKDPRGGIFIYGFLFFIAPLLGLIATYAADRSPGRRIFVYACASTACLCPLVFGAPTETWVAHSLFWPALAVCLYAGGGLGGAALVFALLLALILTHAGAFLFAIAILTILAVRGGGLRDPAFQQTLALFFAAVAIWTAVTASLPPDAYMAEVMHRAALHVFDVSIFTGDLVLLLVAALAAYGLAFGLLMRADRKKAHIHAAWITAALLAVYWIWFDHALHAENRYYLRTILLLATPGFGLLAGAQILTAEGRLALPAPLLPRLLTVLSSQAAARFALGAFAVLMAVHVVETAKFVDGWSHYTTELRKLATGKASDPALGDKRFVSSTRVPGDLNRLSWFSTTQYLSVLVAPNFAPTRLVVDPSSNFFWLSCRTATANLMAQRAISAESRQLVQIEACRHKERR